MSLGTGTVNNSYFQAPSVPSFVDDVSFALDNSYPAGGYTGLAALLQAALASGATYPFVQAGSSRQIVDILTSIDLSGYAVAWDAAHSTIRLFTSNGASPGPLLEVPTGTNLSAVTLRLRVISQ